MNSRKLIAILLSSLLGCTLSIQSANAEEIRIPIGEQAKDQAPIDMPSKGMSQARVKELFGEPLEEAPPKGQPPISRWKYKDFTVYFDSGAVIHSVRNFHPKASPTDSAQ
mgnify:CR=1 FL=1